MRVLKLIALVLLILLSCLAVIIIIAHFYQLSGRNGEMKVAGLTATVNVYYDTYAIPHIIAENAEDAYFALGYVHAQNRLFQMDLLRRVGGGRLSEFFGNKVIEVDKLFHTLGVPEYASNSARDFVHQPQELQNAVQSYLAGVNTFVRNGVTPVEYTIAGLPKEEFEVEDIYQTAGYMAFSFAMGLRTDPLVENIRTKNGDTYLQDLALRYYEGQPLSPISIYDKVPSISQDIVNALDELEMPLFLGSNNWVLSGEKTKSGAPIFANDTHIKYAQPAVWYESHMTYPGTSLYGNFLPGIPLALIGNNQFSIWGLTMLENDDTDFYYETLNEDQSKVRYRDSIWTEVEVREVSINVKGELPVAFKIRKTPHGPIINDFFESKLDAPISMFWTYTQKENNLPKAFYTINHAKNMEETRNAVSLIHAPGLNIAYADVSGNIALWAAAHLLHRAPHVNPKVILNGSDGSDEPLGYYNFDKNPQSENPATGFLYSANSQHDSLNIGVLHDGYYTSSSRMERIAQFLSEDKIFGVEDMKILVSDHYSFIDMRIAHAVCQELEKMNDSSLEELLNMLSKWDGGHAVQDVAPAAYYPLLYYLIKNTYSDELGADNFEIFLGTHLMKRSYQKMFLMEESIWFDDINTDKKEKRVDIFYESAKMALAQINNQHKSVSNLPKWGQVHSLEIKHPMGSQWPLDEIFNIGPYPLSGTNESVDQQGFRLNDSGKYPVQHGPQMRIIADLSDFEHSISVSPSGQSGYFGSANYDDQTQLFVNHEFRLQLMNLAEIQSTAKNHLLLRPE